MKHVTAWIACTIALAVGGTATAQPAPAKKPPARKAAPAKPAPEPPPPAADDEQRAAADLAHYGDYACEFKQTVSVERHAAHPGYADVKFGRQRYTMKPVLSSTGALRLEDVKGQALMIQIASKSMLLDARVGRRLVDDCVHEKQLQARAAAEREPPQPGIGIDPAKAAQAAQAAAEAASAAAAAAAAAASAAAAAASAAAEAASTPASTPR